jgi:exodeoxyribonuclease VII large subunit
MEPADPLNLFAPRAALRHSFPMSDLIDDPAPGQNAPEFTVSEISGAVKRVIEGNFGHVRVRAEVGRVSRPRSGHVYLDLKDDRAVLASVIWKGVASRLAVQPEEGMEVVATGRLTTFPGQSRYQLVIEEVAPAGVGALMAMLEKRKQALAAEGLFAPERKKPLPYLPEVIGVVTSPSGAVIRDILHRLADRFPRRVLLWPVAVQGEKCAAEVANAIRGFNALEPGGKIPRPDVLIVARGGGSIEDLWGFNEEIVVRAAAASEIPLISAVGHETDTTLIDFAADQRAPTPTAAAELAVPVRAELLATVAEYEQRRRRALARTLEDSRRALRDLARILPRQEQLVQEPAQKLDALAGRLPRALLAFAARKRAALAEASRGFSPAMLAAALRERRRRVEGQADRLAPALRRLTSTRRREAIHLVQRLRPDRLAVATARQGETLRALADRAARAQRHTQTAQRDRVAAAGRVLESLSYKGTLARGYAVVRTDGAVAPRAAGVSPGAALEIEFADGRVDATAADGGAEPKKKTPKIRKPSDVNQQGSLF